MEQIKDIFKQVRQAKGSLAFCKEEIINDTLYALADRVEAATDRILEENAKDLAAMDPSNPKYDRLKLTAERIHAIAQVTEMNRRAYFLMTILYSRHSPRHTTGSHAAFSIGKDTEPGRASQWHEADQGKCAFRGDRHYL